jgi:hypothetical protein
MTEDHLVLAKLDQAKSRKIARKLAAIRGLSPEAIRNYVARTVPKERWLDPPVAVGQVIKRLSDFAAKKKRSPRAAI